MSEFNRICVIGLGYIGLPTAAIFASQGVSVVGVDVNQHAIDTINRGEVHIVEFDLDAVVHSVVTKGLLRATKTPEPADAFLIAVPTPFAGDERAPDLRYIEGACRSLAPVLKKGDLIVLESTSPVGATEQMAAWLQQMRPDLAFAGQGEGEPDVNIAHCPERVLPGRILHELVHNDRLIGGITPRCSERAADLYRLFVKGECVLTTARTAELAKLSENSFRDVNIAFANELSMICARLGIDVWELIALANRHPRVNILSPGPGVGGHCIAVDPWFIVSSAPEEARLIRKAREVNDSKPVWVQAQIDEAIAEVLRRDPGRAAPDIRVICYGLAFKANIDDLRESPALEIVRHLAARHPGPIVAVEPNVHELPAQLDGVTLASEPVQAGDVHVLLVDHSQFRTLAIPTGRIVDTRGLWRAGAG
jgi:UDP-N-acetyl-D-mannosaminuronic acid dehydrogenase